jgi:hypothetical protein
VCARFANDDFASDDFAKNDSDTLSAFRQHGLPSQDVIPKHPDVIPKQKIASAGFAKLMQSECVEGLAARRRRSACGIVSREIGGLRGRTWQRLRWFDQKTKKRK